MAQLETLSRKPRSVKQKTSGFAEKGRPALAKVPRLGASSSSPSTPVQKPEGAPSPAAEAPIVLGSQPPSRSAAKVKNLLGGSVELSLAVMPITVWNPPTESVRSPPRWAEELKRKTLESKVGEDGDSLLLNVELAAGTVSSILKDSDLGRSKALPVDEALALSLQGVASVSPVSCQVYFHVDPVLDVDFMFDVQVATHLKGLAEKAKLNEKHVKITRVYKAKVASLTSELSELQERVQRMTEEVEKLKFHLKHTTSARARAESREDEVRNSLTAVESELREVWGELRVAQDDLAETRDGLQSAQYELQVVRDELITSRGGLRESKEELHVANDELRAKVALLDGAYREASEVVVLAERLNEECHGLSGDLHQQISLVTQRDEIIGKLREQASVQWASGWLAFQQMAANAYSGLDFNFDLPSDEEAEESFFANYSQEPGTPAEADSPSVPPADA